MQAFSAFFYEILLGSEQLQMKTTIQKKKSTCVVMKQKD